VKGLEGPFCTYRTQPGHNSGTLQVSRLELPGLTLDFLLTIPLLTAKNLTFLVKNHKLWSQLTTNGKFLYTLIFVPEVKIFHQAIYKKFRKEEKLHETHSD
jgi:hypothetical protein